MLCQHRCNPLDSSHVIVYSIKLRHVMMTVSCYSAMFMDSKVQIIEGFVVMCCTCWK